MDPNLFHVEWDQLAEMLAVLIVLSFFVERSLALLFENSWYVGRFGKLPIKEPIAFAASLFVCARWDFDAVGILLRGSQTSFLGEALTAAIIAGGSKASIKLFQDVMGVGNLSTPRRTPETEPVAQ